MEHKSIIEKAWDNQELLNDSSIISAIEEVIEMLDKGKLRIADNNDGNWVVHEWVKKAVVLYFPIRKWKLLKLAL